jgi:hypothetical protein
MPLPTRRTIKPSSRRNCRRRFRYTASQLELLENRQLLTTYTVVQPGDDATFYPGVPPSEYTLRDAIDLSNMNPGPNVINFDITDAPPVIDLLGPIQVRTPVTIDGTTQPGYNGKPVVVLDGVVAGVNDGIEIYGNNSTVRGLDVVNFPGTGVVLYGNHNSVQGNFIGVDTNGSTPDSNLANQVDIEGANNTVGGTSAAARNIISGTTSTNVPAITIYGSGAKNNTIEGNYIGTDATGTKIVGNAGTAIYIAQGATSNTIGGSTAGAGNVISGNVNSATAASQGFAVVQIDGTGTNKNVIAGNFIGTDPTGTKIVGNGGPGVLIDSSAANNTVGGTTAAARNVISGNKSAGIEIITGATQNVVAGNDIGTNAQGTAALPNSTSGIIISAPANTIGGSTSASRNIISGNKEAGVAIVGTVATKNVVEGDYIGTNASGNTSSPATLGNQGDGVDIYGGASSNTIGGTTATVGSAPGNVISNNAGAGIYILDTDSNATKNNVVEGNCIGTDQSGSNPLPNHFDGVAISNGASNNTIGGQGSEYRNLISGNSRDGVLIYNANLNTVEGDYFGTNIQGELPTGPTNPLANLNAVAINGGSNNTIGAAPQTAPVDSKNNGSLPLPASNLIRANRQDGVVITGNATGDRVSLNVIYGNQHMGIDLGGNITTLESANSWQAYPILTSVTDSGGFTTIVGRLMVSSGAYTIEFYANAGVDRSGLSEGQWFLGTATATYNAALGYAPINARFATPVIPNPTTVWNNRPVQDHFITATAIAANGSTSEFSPARDVLRGAVQITFQGTDMEAKFVPEANPILGGRLNLAGAAAVCGVNHFNWIQFVTPPAPWQFFIVHNGHGVAAPTPVTDPVENAPAYSYELQAPGHPICIISIDGATDGFRFVYNEVNESNSPYNLADQIKTISGVGQVLEFADSPELPTVVAGLLSFQTYLVGIPFAPGTAANDTRYIQWAGLSTGFSWQTDAKTNPSNGRYVSGGVRNVGFLLAGRHGKWLHFARGKVSGVRFLSGIAER